MAGLILVLFYFWDRVLLCHPFRPGTHFADQAGLKLREILLPVLLEWVLGLEMCTTSHWPAMSCLVLMTRETTRISTQTQCQMQNSSHLKSTSHLKSLVRSQYEWAWSRTMGWHYPKCHAPTWDWLHVITEHMKVMGALQGSLCYRPVLAGDLLHFWMGRSWVSVKKTFWSLPWQSKS